MLGSFGHDFTYQRTDAITLAPGETKELHVYTLRHFKYVTGIVANSLFSYINLSTGNNIIMSVRQFNKPIISNFPESLILQSNGIGFIDNFLRFNALAAGEKLTIILTNNNSTTIKFDFILLLQNNPYEQIYDYDIDSASITTGQSVKLNLNAKCKHIDNLILLQTVTGAVHGSFAIKDRTVTFVDIVADAIIGIRYSELSKRLLPVDIPVTELYVEYTYTSIVTHQLRFLYRYKIKNEIGIDHRTKELKK